MKTKRFIIMILMAITMLFISSCTEPVLKKNEYKIIDTLYINRNGINSIMSYDVIIKYDSSFYYGNINKKGELLCMNIHKLKIDKLK